MNPQESQALKEEIVATKGKFKSVFSIIEIPVDQSVLPVRKIAKFSEGPDTTIENDDRYSYDARNPLLKLRFQIEKSDGVQSHNKSENICISFRKQGLTELFERLEQIQDKLDLYT